MKERATSADIYLEEGLGRCLLSFRTGRTVFHTLFFKLQNTGLTGTSTEFSMSKVADRGLRFRLVSSSFKVVLLRGCQGTNPLLTS
jgi:hypothetical protein